MSGGHFDYKQYAIRDILEDLESRLHEKVDEEFRNVVVTAIHHLKYSYEYVHALDYCFLFCLELLFSNRNYFSVWYWPTTFLKVG